MNPLLARLMGLTMRASTWFSTLNQQQKLIGGAGVLGGLYFFGSTILTALLWIVGLPLLTIAAFLVYQARKRRQKDDDGDKKAAGGAGRFVWLGAGVILALIVLVVLGRIGSWVTELKRLEDLAPYPGAIAELCWKKLPGTEGDSSRNEACESARIVAYDEFRFDFRVGTTEYRWDRREERGTFRRRNANEDQGTWTLAPASRRDLNLFHGNIVAFGGGPSTATLTIRR